MSSALYKNPYEAGMEKGMIEGLRQITPTYRSGSLK